MNFNTFVNFYANKTNMFTNKFQENLENFNKNIKEQQDSFNKTIKELHDSFLSSIKEQQDDFLNFLEQQHKDFIGSIKKDQEDFKYQQHTTNSQLRINNHQSNRYQQHQHQNQVQFQQQKRQQYYQQNHHYQIQRQQQDYHQPQQQNYHQSYHQHYHQKHSQQQQKQQDTINTQPQQYQTQRHQQQHYNQSQQQRATNTQSQKYQFQQQRQIIHRSHHNNQRQQLSINDFKPIKFINEGGFGKLYLAQEIRTKNQYAIKLINKKLIKDRNNILKENRAMELLNSRYCIKLYGTFEDDNYYYIAMEYINGEDLSCHLERSRRFSVSRTINFAAQLLLAIEHVHQLGIVHADIKPANILVTNDDKIKLIDFGLCKFLQPNTNFFMGRPTGTPLYVSPEIVTPGRYSLQSDLWALGICIFEFLVGYTPFDSDNVNNVINNIVQNNINWPQKGVLPDYARDIIVQLLNPNPSKRPSIEQIKNHGFFAGVDWNNY